MIAPTPTPASTVFSSLLSSGDGDDGEGVRGGEEAEVCPEGLLVAKEMGRRVVGCGGAALVVDYGSQYITRHTLRVS